MNLMPHWGFFKVEDSHSWKAQRRRLISLRREVYYSSLTSALTARFDIAVMFVVGKINEDTVGCLWFVAFESASCKDSCFNVVQLTKKIYTQRTQGI